DDEADDAPHLHVVDGADQAGAGQPRDLAAGADAAPPDRLAVPVGHHPRGMLPLAPAAHGLLATATAQAFDLRRWESVRQAPAVVEASVAVDDVREIVEAFRGHRMRFPPHDAISTPSTDMSRVSPVGVLHGRLLRRR